MGIDFPLSTFFLLHFGKCPDSVICFWFSFYFHLTYHVLQDSVSNMPYKQEYVTVNNNQCLIRIQIWCGHRIWVTNTVIFMTLGYLRIHHTTAAPFSSPHIWIRILVVYIVKISRERWPEHPSGKTPDECVFIAYLCIQIKSNQINSNNFYCYTNPKKHNLKSFCNE
jgi:hypothetical protein